MRLNAALTFLSILVLCFTPSTFSYADETVPLNGRLGIAHISSIDVPRTEERYERALALGAGWNRWPLYWDRVEAPRGAFDWSEYDALVIEDLSYGLQLNVILLGIAPHHRDGNTIVHLSEPVFADGTDTPAPEKGVNPENPWARFVAAAVERYRPGGSLAQAENWPAAQGVRVWEIWNEPDFEFFWSGGVADYARLLKVAYLVIQSIDPDATVMVGGLLYPTQDNWLAQILSIYQDEPDPAAQNWYMDAVAVHNYGDAWRSGWLTLVARQTLVEFGLERPIWLTETGVPIWDDYPGPVWARNDREARSLLTTAAEQAAFLVQSAAYAWAEGARVVIYHQLYDDCGNQPPGTDFAPTTNANLCQPGEICAGDVFGIYRNPADAVCFSQHPQPDTARPVADAFLLLSHVFGEQAFSRRGIVEDAEPDGVIRITFTRPETDERIVVMWNTHLAETEITLDALGTGAALYSLESIGLREIAPDDGVYRLTLEPALTERQRFLEDRLKIDIGGPPLILVETVTDSTALERLEFLTFEAQTLPVDAVAPPALDLSDTQIDALIATSPSGVIFYSRDNARLRTLPTTEGSQVITTLGIGDALPVIGRLEDDSWFLLDLNGQQVWVAGFLGVVYGNMTAIPIITPDPTEETAGT